MFFVYLESSLPHQFIRAQQDALWSGRLIDEEPQSNDHDYRNDNRYVKVFFLF